MSDIVDINSKEALKRLPTRRIRTKTEGGQGSPADIAGGGGSERYSDAKTALAKIGERFKEARSTAKTTAWRRLIDDVAQNLDVLCSPNAEGVITISMKDALAMMRECEEFVKGNEGAGQNPLEVVREFLTQ